MCISRTGPLPTVARRSRTLPLCTRFVTQCRVWCPCSQVPLPRTGNATRLYHQFGLGSSRFARRYSGSRMLLSLPRGTQMFQFPRFPPPALCVQAGVTPHDGCRVSPFGYPRINAWSAAPRGFSQPPTSFIGIRRQGIHRWLFVAWISSSDLDARACSSVLKGRRGAELPQEVRPSHDREAAPASSPGPRARRPDHEGRGAGALPQNGTEEDRRDRLPRREAREPANDGWGGRPSNE